MTRPDLGDLVRQTPFSFVGTIEYLGGATSSDLPISDRTAVALVDVVLHAPPQFQQLAGQRLTVQFADDSELPEVGSQVAIFAEGLAFGETIAVREVARVPLRDIAPYVNQSAQVGGGQPFAAIERELEAQALREHVEEADVVVVGTVRGLEIAAQPEDSEHDPQWWRATIDVRQVVRGRMKPRQLEVLYPNSLDLQWARVPKPKASQDALWILHRTKGDLRELGRYQLLHPQDRQPVAALTTIEGQ
jgi:hypothetical protein